MEQLGGKLPVNDDAVFVRRHRRFQLFGWVLIALILAAAATGFLGSAGYSRHTKSTADFSYTYDRVMHRQTPGELRIRFKGRPENGIVAVRINSDYLHKVEIEKITPQPKEAKLTEGGIAWDFAADESLDASEIHFSIQPMHPGTAVAEIRVGKGTAKFKQLILP